jgi:signal transduction histidine kinase
VTAVFNPEVPARIGAGADLRRVEQLQPGLETGHPGLEDMPASTGTGRNVREVSADRAAAPTLARLRRARGQQEAIVRWLQRLSPLLLVLFVGVALLSRPEPGVSGRGLVVAVAVAAFVVGVLGRNATAARLGGAHLGFVATLLVSAATLTLAQPGGPGAEALLVAVLCLARLLPGRAAIPVLVVSFVAVEVTAVITARPDLAVLTALAGFYGMLYLAFRLGEANKQAERLVAELRESQAARARSAKLAERQHLAREMHDVLAHSLSGLMLQLEGARMLAAEDPTDPRLPEVIDRAHHLGKTGLEEARRAIGTLRDDELPGPDRLPGLAARFQEDRGISCRFTVSGEAYELGSEARVALYRVAQEALTNITKHARPERVELRLAYEPSVARLTIEDFARDGGGPPSANGDGGGYGLTGMRERAELLGGALTARTTCDGFRVELDVPT